MWTYHPCNDFEWTKLGLVAVSESRRCCFVQIKTTFSFHSDSPDGPANCYIELDHSRQCSIGQHRCYKERQLLEKILRGFKILPNIVINKRCFAQNAQHSLSTFLYKVQLKGYSLEYRLLHKWDCMERSEPKFMFEVESNFVSSGWFTFPRWKRIWENLSQSQLTEVTTSQL